MRFDFDARKAALAGACGLGVVILGALILVQVLGSNGGFDAIDPIDTDNNPPVIESAPDRSIESAVGEVVTPIVIRASDADLDDLSYRAINLPAGIAIDAKTGTISGTTTSPCACEVSIIAEDGRGGSDTASVVWVVTDDSGRVQVDSTPPALMVEEELASGPTTSTTKDPTATAPPSTTAQTTTTTTTTTTPPSTTVSSSTTSSSTTSSSSTTGSPSTASPTTVSPNAVSPTTTVKPTTTTTTTTTTVTTTMATTTTTLGEGNRGSATFEGVRGFDSFFQGRKQYDAWTAGDIAFYAPQGQVPTDVGTKWMNWYVRVDELYRVVSGRSDFDRVYRRDTPDLGRRKVLAIVETCGAGCGSKQQAEADPGYINALVSSPDDYKDHWIFFYEMGRGGSSEPWYGKATWPKNTVILPHLMAGLAYFDLGGEAGLRQPGIPGDLLRELERWEAEDIEYVDHFTIENQQTVGNYTSHHLMPGMLWKIRMETDLATVGRITANMATKPPSTSATQAMCDFRAAVNDATAGAFDARMTGPWGLPDQC